MYMQKKFTASKIIMTKYWTDYFVFKPRGFYLFIEINCNFILETQSCKKLLWKKKLI